MHEEFEIESQTGLLRGRLTHAEGRLRGVIVCLHGQPGGDLSGNDGIFDELANLSRPLGYTSVQFSFCGAPPSDGSADQITLASQLADYSSVLSFVRTRFQAPIHIAGESAGATIAALRWERRVASYILLWPAFDLADTDLRSFLDEETREAARQTGSFDEGGLILGADFLDELATSDFSACFDLPDTDIFIGHGQADREVPYLQSLRALPTAKGRLLFVSHPEAGHGFKDRAARAYLKAYLREWLATH